MPKTSRGGRRIQTSTLSNLNFGNQQQNQQQNQQSTQNQNVQATPLDMNSLTLTDGEAQTIRDTNKDNYNTDVVDAIKNYIADDARNNSNGFSTAQNLNFKLDNGQKLNATEKFIDREIQAGMHSIGKDTMLTRACHDDIIQKLGITNYDQYTEKQLKQALIGSEYTTMSYSSASYDTSKNPFLNGSQSGGREVIMKIKANANTQMVFGARKQAEVVLNKGTRIRVTNVSYTGQTATPRTGRSRKQIVLEVETY